MKRGERILAGLDVGRCSTKVVIAAMVDEQIQVLGMGRASSRDTRHARTTSTADISEPLEEAMDAAERMAGVDIERVDVVLSGCLFQSKNRHGMSLVDNGEITHKEIEAVRRTATALPTSTDQTVIAAVSQGFHVDDTTGVANPMGLSATRLYGRYHVVSVPRMSIRAVERTCASQRLHLDNVVVESLVSAEGVLFDDERELGVAVLDIGAESTSIAVYRRGLLVYTGLMPMGGSALTHQLAAGLRVPMGTADELLRAHGCVHDDALTEADTIEIPGIGGRPPRSLPRQSLVELLQPTLEELICRAAQCIQEAGFEVEALDAGVVLTGGVANLDGIDLLAEEVLGIPARRGIPRELTGLGNLVEAPEFAAVVGMLRRSRDELLQVERHAMSFSPRTRGSRSSSFRRLSDWLRAGLGRWRERSKQVAEIYL